MIQMKIREIEMKRVREGVNVLVKPIELNNFVRRVLGMVGGLNVDDVIEDPRNPKT